MLPNEYFKTYKTMLQWLMKEFLNIIILSLLLILLVACSSKKLSPTKVVEVKKTYILNNLITDLKINCMAVIIDDNNTKIDNYISIDRYENYLKIELNTKNDFPNDYFRLSHEAEDKLSCLASSIKKEKKLLIQILGYAKAPDEQHLADDRAITVAELLFNNGVRDEIYAKGCLKTKPIQNGLSIFLYKDSLSLKNRCKFN